MAENKLNVDARKKEMERSAKDAATKADTSKKRAKKVQRIGHGVDYTIDKVSYPRASSINRMNFDASKIGKYSVPAKTITATAKGIGKKKK